MEKVQNEQISRVVMATIRRNDLDAERRGIL